MNVQTVYKVRRAAGFTTIINETLRDPRLSWKAKGLLAVMLSYPDDWDFSIEHLLTITTCGRDATRSAMQELIAAGYIHRQHERDEAGRIVKLLIVVSEVPDDISSTDGFPGAGDPGAGKPNTTKTYKPTKTEENEDKHLSFSASPKADARAEEKISIEDEGFDSSLFGASMTASPSAKRPSPSSARPPSRKSKLNPKIEDFTPEQIALVEQVREAWNRSCKPLPRFTAITGHRAQKVVNYASEFKGAGIDPIEGFAGCAIYLSTYKPYVEGGHGIDALMRQDRPIIYYESYLNAKTRGRSSDFNPGYVEPATLVGPSEVQGWDMTPVPFEDDEE